MQGPHSCRQKEEGQWQSTEISVVICFLCFLLIHRYVTSNCIIYMSSNYRRQLLKYGTIGLVTPQRRSDLLCFSAQQTASRMWLSSSIWWCCRAEPRDAYGVHRAGSESKEIVSYFYSARLASICGDICMFSVTKSNAVVFEIGDICVLRQ